MVPGASCEGPAAERKIPANKIGMQSRKNIFMGAPAPSVSAREMLMDKDVVSKEECKRIRTGVSPHNSAVSFFGLQ
jgi:hypothetical protein